MKKSKIKPLVLIELNEINFDLINKYLETEIARFKNLEALQGLERIATTSESKYKELEPWIQWVSVHTGLSLSEHGIYRLGDIVISRAPQIFELVESAGFKVGCISPMNAANKLKTPTYFIPDPWTQTPHDGSLFGSLLTSALVQSVNDNALGKVKFKTAIIISACFVYFFNPKKLKIYFWLLMTCIKAPWRKALFLDLLLHDIHLKLLKRRSPDFSTIFFNAGAHIQHHYFLSSPYYQEDREVRNPEWYIKNRVDPMRDVLKVYDSILGDYIKDGSREIIIATGLSQIPYDRVKYYYRLRNHSAFIKKLWDGDFTVEPRMTRDFLVKVKSNDDAIYLEEILKSAKDAKTGKLFFEEIENRGKELFVTLTYPEEITEDTVMISGDTSHSIFNDTVFVAIKNGMHQGGGVIFASKGLSQYLPSKGSHVKSIFLTIKAYFCLK